MYNRTQLMGRVVKDPEKKNLSSFDLTQFTIAQNRKVKDKETSHYYDCKAWGKLSQRAMTLKKGDLIILEGRLDQETWTKQDGSKASKLVINIQSLQLIPKLEKLNYDTSEGIYPAIEVDYTGAGEEIF